MTLAQLRALRESPRWMLAAGAVRLRPRLVALALTLAVLASLAPTAFSLATGALIATLPHVTRSADPDSWRQLIGPVAPLGAIFVFQQVIGPMHFLASDALGRRLMGSVYRRAMRATLTPATIAHLEDPELHNQVRQSLNESWAGPRNALNALIAWGVERLRGAIALAVVAHFNVLLALLLAVAWLIHLQRMRAVHRQLIQVRFIRTESTRYADYLADVLTSAGTAKEVRIFGLGRWFSEHYERTWLSALGELWEKRRDLLPRTVQATLLVLLVDALVFWLLGRAAVTGEIGVGALFVYVNAVIESGRFGDVTEADLQVEYGTAGLKPLAALEHLVATDPRLVLPGSRPASDLPQHAIRFEGVAFQYPGQNNVVFRNLTLEIPVGQSLAIVGANGAGKTTLIKLLARLYDPTEGRIAVDGIDLREIDPHGWQRRVAAIFQDFLKYELSALDNVALGAVARQHDRALVTDAARRAGALDLIEGLPHGWDTVLSRRYTGGVDLSGGQWQRIALARALFAASAGAPVLIMDEPTAQLDVRAEAAFYDSFLDLTHGLTTIVISHRFSTVRRASRIVVLDKGGAVEQGTHDELMALRGTYAHMFTLQAQRFVDAAVPA